MTSLNGFTPRSTPLRVMGKQPLKALLKYPSFPSHLLVARKKLAQHAKDRKWTKEEGSGFIGSQTLTCPGYNTAYQGH